MIKSTYRPSADRRRPVTASQSVTGGVTNRNAVDSRMRINSYFEGLTPVQASFAKQIQANSKSGPRSIMGATNTSNIPARPDFLELLPLFVQKLLITDIFGSVAMNSRHQLIPYYKVMAENTKGETQAHDIMASPFVNMQGRDPNFTGKIVPSEIVENAAGAFTVGDIGNGEFVPLLPGSVSVDSVLAGVVTRYSDDINGNMVDSTGAIVGTIDYSDGTLDMTAAAITLADGDLIKATYQYDNETVGPNAAGRYGAGMGKSYLQFDTFDLVAEAHQLACYHSVYAAFAAQTEYGSDLLNLQKTAAIGEITAEINAKGFYAMLEAATPKPQFNWDAGPVLSASVVPSDYMNTFKLQLTKASNSVYQATRLARPNRLIIGTNVASYLTMVNGVSVDNAENTVGPYHFGKLDHFEIYVDPNYDPNTWVMCAKSNDIQYNSGLFGEYMPLTESNPIGLADASIQQGYFTMYAMKVVNPATVVSGKIIGLN